MNNTSAPRENWSSSLGFILATAGSAIGLGNIWKFPYITGENGGGAFVLIYLLCIAVIGLPVMLCEITLGRHTRRNPVGAFAQLNPGRSTMAQFIAFGLALCGICLMCFGRLGWGVVALVLGGAVYRWRWIVVGAMGVLAGFVILSFYSVIAGWTLGYIVKAVTGGLGFASKAAAEDAFVGFATSPLVVIGYHFLFMVLCVLIVYRGVRGGIERWSKILMPILFVLLVVLIIRGMSLPGAAAGVQFFLSPDFSRITTESVLVALGHAFFSLSLGMGAIITYGSYVRKDQNLFLSSLSVVALDTLIALMAGLAIFPAVFAMGFEPSKGVGLAFMVLPTVFAQMPAGALWATLFFVLLAVAALTSGISLLEVVTAYFVDERKWSRKRAAVVFGGVIFALGCLCAVSVDKDLTGWGKLAWMEQALAAMFGDVPGCFFDVMDGLASNWMLPLGGMLISIFVGWVWGTHKAIEEIRKGSLNFADVHLWSLMSGLKDDPSHNSDIHVLTLASLWGIFIRFISPIAVLIAFLNTIGWLDLGTPSTPSAPAPVEQAAAADGDTP